VATTHQRTVIRAAFVAALKDTTRAEERVVSTRIWPWKEKDLPALAVYTLTESVDPASRTTAPRELERNVDVAIEGVVQLSDAVDDELDAFAVEIERAVDAILSATAPDQVLSDLLLQSTELAIATEGEQSVGLVRLVYDVRYYTRAPEADDVPLEDLKTVDVRYSDLDGGEDISPNDQASDRLDNLDE
jgi:hypothetical protein